MSDGGNGGLTDADLAPPAGACLGMACGQGVERPPYVLYVVTNAGAESTVRIFGHDPEAARPAEPMGEMTAHTGLNTPS